MRKMHNHGKHFIRIYCERKKSILFEFDFNKSRSILCEALRLIVEAFQLDVHFFTHLSWYQNLVAIGPSHCKSHLKSNIYWLVEHLGTAED